MRTKTTLLFSYSSSSRRIPQAIFVRQGSRILEQELVKVLPVYRNIRYIWLDVFCLPAFSCEKEVRESLGRVGWKFRTGEVRQNRA